MGGLYKLDVMNHQALSSTTMFEKKLWHSRYGHLNHKDLILIQKKNMVQGFPIIKNEHVECDGCALDKRHRNEVPTVQMKGKKIFLN